MLYSLAVFALLGVAQAIYPDNHWNHATKLTVNKLCIAVFYLAIADEQCANVPYSLAK
jgi:hypothetical protein